MYYFINLERLYKINLFQAWTRALLICYWHEVFACWWRQQWECHDNHNTSFFFSSLKTTVKLKLLWISNTYKEQVQQENYRQIMFWTTYIAHKITDNHAIVSSVKIETKNIKLSVILFLTTLLLAGPGISEME